MKTELTTEQRAAIKAAARIAGVKLEDTRIAGNPRRSPTERLYAAAGIRINGGEPANADRRLPGGPTIGEVLTLAGIWIKKYTLELRDDAGCTEDIAIEAIDNDAAIREVNDSVQSHADDWCESGEWGDDGASVGVRWTLLDADGAIIDAESVTVEIERLASQDA